MSTFKVNKQHLSNNDASDHVVYIFSKTFNCYVAVPRPTLGHYWVLLTDVNHFDCAISTQRSPGAS